MNNKKAFTLIELLVVVLIIGILAAVALPQYQRATEKSRATQILVTGRAMVNALDRYYEENASYPTAIEELDTTYTCPVGYACAVGGVNGGTSGKFQMSRQDPWKYGFIFRMDDDATYSKEIHCYAEKTDPKSVSICKSFSTVLAKPENTPTYYFYKL